MSIVITRYPSTTDNGNACKFSRAGNPLYFELSRQDYAIVSIQQQAGFYQFNLASTSMFTLNEKIYYNTNAGSGTALIFDIGANYIAVLAIYNPASTSGHINKISDTKREIEVSGVINSNGVTDFQFNPRRFSYDSTGVVKVYINQIVKDYFAKVYNVNPSGNALVVGACFNLDLTFEDVEDGSTAIDSKHYAVKAVGQLGDDNRMIEYEVYSYGTTFSEAKFLTAFAKPVLFRGYPFHLYALMGRNDDVVYRRQYTLDGFATDTVVPSTPKGIYSMALAPQSATQRRFNVYLHTNVAENENYLLIDGNDTLLIDSNSQLRIN